MTTAMMTTAILAEGSRSTEPGPTIEKKKKKKRPSVSVLMRRSRRSSGRAS